MLKRQRFGGKIIAAKAADPQVDTRGLEAQVDETVYKLYGLTAEEGLSGGGEGVMANLTISEKKAFEYLFEMSFGYVLDFSNKSFAQFINETINIDIYNSPGYKEYCSKANKLRQIWSDEKDNVVGRLLDELLSYYEDYCDKNGKFINQRQVDKLRLVTKKLLETHISIELPINSEETLSTLLDDIKNALERNNPVLVLDRLHTFSVKFIHQICNKNGIKTKNDKHELYPLHSLVGQMTKYYKQNSVFQSEFILIAMKYSISVFEKFNEIRNNESYARDNEVLNETEAEFVVKTISNLLVLINRFENIQEKRRKNTKQVTP